jgi:2-dehydro-3-deoxygluconokinase
MPDFDLLTLGEVLLSLRPTTGGLARAGQYDLDLSGAEASVAVGLARLGLKSCLMTRLTDNPFGRSIADRLASYGIDCGKILWTPRDRIGLRFVEESPPPRSHRIMDDRAGSAFSKIRPVDLPEDTFDLNGAKMLYLTSITPVLSFAANSTALRALKMAEDANSRIAFGVKFLPGLASSTDTQLAAEPYLRSADIAFIALRTARALFGFAASVPVERVLESLAAYYPQSLWIMTLGSDGAIARGRDGTITRQEAFPAVSISRLGAGDAFAAGFLAAHLRGFSLPESLRWGCAAAAIKRATPGDIADIDPADLRHLLG